jgi:hypothetical protein
MTDELGHALGGSANNLRVCKSIAEEAHISRFSSFWTHFWFPPAKRGDVGHGFWG